MPNLQQRKKRLTIKIDLFLPLTLFLGLASSAMAQEKPASPPPSAEVQAVIEELRTLRIPETLSFLKRVDPKVFAQALKTPEGRWAMNLASRWSVPFPDLYTEAGKWELLQYREKLSREFATVPQAVIDPLAYWRMSWSPEFLNLSDEERHEIVNTEDAFRSGAFLSQLSPVQREAVYELHDLGTAIHNRHPGLAGILKEHYALFTQWGPEKLRQVLEAPWSAAEFLKAFGRVFLDQGWKWKLSTMPSWFWQEIAEFTEGPNAAPTFSLLEMGSMMLGGAYMNAHIGLVFLARALKDDRMMKGIDAINAQFDADHPELQKAVRH
ncbi:hypothetical protein [Methylacidimicrobium sp. B4]|uniref:hypothetical protein n=1 Tax=Methylacidimicrobium sp. B4 TaxID=2796139 RepID=UPI001A8DD126|nr:hypothetical protein [Methylacidimicrobium sp. B4]QSR84710.1 hypothetical protein MacB4_11070 [Methylacidimicrobium sp. B4]